MKLFSPGTTLRSILVHQEIGVDDLSAHGSSTAHFTEITTEITEHPGIPGILRHHIMPALPGVLLQKGPIFIKFSLGLSFMGRWAVGQFSELTRALHRSSQIFTATSCTGKSWGNNGQQICQSRGQYVYYTPISPMVLGVPAKAQPQFSICGHCMAKRGLRFPPNN